MGAALIFPGHAATRLDASLRAFAGSPQMRPLLERAAEMVRTPLARLVERPSLLDRVQVFQPMLVALELGIAARLRDAGADVSIVAGHSLGEIAAWSAAGCIDAVDAVRLAALRGALLAREAALHPGGMVAVATSDAAVIEDALAAGRRAGDLHFASDSAPDEVVFCGEEAAIRAVIAAVPAIAKRVPTEGPWHGPRMNGAVRELREAHREAPRSRARTAIVTNADGEIARDEDALPDLFADQIARPIAWTRTLGTVAARASAAVIVGPGSVMRALWRRRFPAGSAPPLLATDNERALAETIAILRR